MFSNLTGRRSMPQDEPFIVPRREEGFIYSAILRIITVITCMISATVLGFSAAFGGALAVYTVRYITDTLIVAPVDGVGDDPSPDDCVTYYYNIVPSGFLE